MDSIYGSWEDSFQTLFSFRTELLQRSPNSIFEIATKPVQDVVTYMNQHHNHLWRGSMFSNDIKCVNNNISESFNNWVKKIKDLPLVDLIDTLRRMIMDLWDKRRRIGSKLSGTILPTIIKASHEPEARKQQQCTKCGVFGHRDTRNCPLNEKKEEEGSPIKEEAKKV